VSDITQGQDNEQNDGALFREVLDAPTLDKFENPPPLPDQPDKPDKPVQQPEAPVPPGRLREESERARRAEREVSDLRARLAAYEVNQQQRPQQAPQKLDVFDNPAGFVKQEVGPLLDQFRAEMQMTREAMSADNAVRVFGEENVSAARQALEQGMSRQDPNAWATYNRAMSSHDPYGVITRWHMDRQTLQQIGGDLDAYRSKILDEALKDPEFQKRVFAAARGQAQANGSQINSVTQPQVPNIPSLSDIGAAGPDEQMQQPSEEALFRAAVSAKRRS
jgi:hypothetical protein